MVETVKDAQDRLVAALLKTTVAFVLLEATTVKLEKLAAGGTHGDLPGNGQEKDGNVYL